MDKCDFFNNAEYSEFIEDFENNWLQYATAEERMKAYFGTKTKALSLFERWKKGEDIWNLRKDLSWILYKKSSKN